MLVTMIPVLWEDITVTLLVPMCTPLGKVRCTLTYCAWVWSQLILLHADIAICLINFIPLKNKSTK